MLSYGLRLPVLPRTTLLGLVYLALHLGTAVYLHDSIGVIGPGPWLPAGIGLAFLIMGGMPMMPFVFFGNVIAAYVLLPASSGSLRFAWPFILTLTWGLGAWEIRRVSPQFHPWTARLTLHFASVCLVISALAASLGSALLKSGSGGSVVPLHSLLLSILEPQLLGLLLVTPVVLLFAGSTRPGSESRRYFNPVSWMEVALQAVGLLLGLWLLARTDASGWFLGLLVLAWISIRQGMAIGCFAALLLCLAVGANAAASIPDVDGLRSCEMFELVCAALALGLGSWADEGRRRWHSLQQSCDRVDLVMEHANAGIWDWQHGQPICFQGAWHNLCNLPPGTCQIGEEFWRSLIHPEDLPRVVAARDAHLRGESPRYEIEYRLRSASGFYRWVFDRGIVMRRDGTGRGVRMVGLCMDLSSRKHAENSQLRFLDILESASDAVAASDLHGNVFYANRSLLALHGDSAVPSAQARHISDFFGEEAAKPLLRDILPAALSSGSWWGASELVDAAGRSVPVSLGVSVQRDPAGHPRAYSFVLRRMDHIHLELPKMDTSELEARARNERQESLRLLAGGAVHGFNNVLMAIMGNAFLARKDLPAEAPSMHFFRQIDSAGQRGSQLCHSLQLFSGKVPPGNTVVDFNAHLRGALTELLKELPNADQVSFLPAAELPGAVADAKQISKVLRHALLNSLEAYGDTPGPVRVATALVELDPSSVSSPAPTGLLRRGQFIQLSISDSGPGVDPVIHSRIFDPFFSTKAGHKGMGLAELAGVVRGHGGFISVESEPGSGFCLRLHFPLVQQRPGATATRPPMPVANDRWRGSGMILVIDDEETVREVAASMLESIGFSPVVAKDGLEGLRVLRQHGDAVKAILLDFSMPLLDGEGTLLEIAKLRPEVPVLFMTGHGARDFRPRSEGTQIVGLLGKPFSMEVLQMQLRKALGLS